MSQEELQADIADTSPICALAVIKYQDGKGSTRPVTAREMMDPRGFAEQIKLRDSAVVYVAFVPVLYVEAFQVGTEVNGSNNSN